MDLHQKEIQGFFNIPVDNLRASPFLLQYIQEEVRNACYYSCFFFILFLSCLRTFETNPSEKIYSSNWILKGEWSCWGREWCWELLVLLFSMFKFCFPEELVFSYPCSNASFFLRYIPLTLKKKNRIFFLLMSSSFPISSFLTFIGWAVCVGINLNYIMRNTLEIVNHERAYWLCSESQAGGWKSHPLFVRTACLDLRSLTWDVLCLHFSNLFL